MQSHPAIPTFSELYEQYQLDDDALWEISRASKVSKTAIDVMLLGSQVEPEDVQKVLSALSQQTGTHWTLDNTAIPYVGETFSHLYQRCQIDASRLSTQSGVPIATIEQMIMGHPVDVSDAMKVLQMLSRIVGKNYTLDNVSVQLEKAGRHD